MSYQQTALASEASRAKGSDRFKWLNALFPALPCAESHWGCMYIKRFHVPTCLFCRWRRAQSGHYTVPKYFIEYIYLSMQWLYSPVVATVNGKQYFVGWRQVPTTLKIDPRGHFTNLRCFTIVALDKLFKKMKITNSHRLANVCEFLACYPTW
jgi:hypothetical protein